MRDAASGSVERFDGRSEDYARFRPSYPPGAIDVVLESLGDPRDVVAIDAGAGTGIALRLLRDRGVRAIGLEPNDGMRGRAVADGLDVRPGTVLANGLPLGEAGLVTAFQAFHWFANEASARALAALLRPGGRIALVWNLFERADAFTDAFCDLLDRFADSHRIAGLGIERAAAASDAAVDGNAVEGALASAGFAHRRIREVPYVQRLDEAALLGRLRSSSSAPTAGTVYETMAAALHDVVIRRAADTGERDHPLVHRTHVVLAELAPRANRG